jgi:carboxymethylenebutenolidase
MSDVRIPTPAGDLPAHLAVPEGSGPWPGVVVIHEAYGLNADIRSWADRFAGEGYLAVAPDLLHWGASVRCLLAAFRSLRSGRGRAFAEIDAARAHLGARDDCTGRVGIVGFCMGGGFALLGAVRGFDVSAPNYAPLPPDPDDALRGACPIVASYGGRDRGSRGAAPKLDATLERLGVPHDVKEYPDANHSFLNRHEGWQLHLARIAGIGFHGPSADDAWTRIRAFLATHLEAAAGAERT